MVNLPIRPIMGIEKRGLFTGIIKIFECIIRYTSWFLNITLKRSRNAVEEEAVSLHIVFMCIRELTVATASAKKFTFYFSDLNLLNIL